MALTYRSLSDKDKTAITTEIAKRKAPPAAPDAAMLAAWEADHYAHTLLLAAATDPEVQDAHREAINALEASITSGRKSS